ncbi:MAG: T9SS type A sorting domain-containing protein [Flavobacteriales bacterium]|nr:T9SS type A sorting domain-containing protein [Flavobacteriales bacterium]
MKKAFLSVLTVFTLSSFAQVQLKIEDAANPGANIDGTTITVVDVASVFEIELDLHVINEGTNTVELAVRTSEIDVCANTSNATCWVVCPPFNNAGDSPVQTSAFSETIAPNDTVISFAAHYKPENLDCCSMFKYEWLDKGNFNAVVASVIVRFDHTNAGTVCAVSVKEQEVNAEVLISPNPANDKIVLSLSNIENFNGISIHVFDMLGKKVSSISQVGPINNLNVSEFKNGMYFVSIMKNESLIKTSKLIKE